ncbi:class I SAM-dependent methyltransferase [Porticoccus hydrocarbonoclasticus]|uniref:class I SAM-dependent methyltransferase n=1 Tax=Porticoccus hydrocarbonoclasticus TaxID=1073414 RepID=UPI000690D068|nr:methyltransferase domain-containing protein [Porticoccus hydrocarbonoclasticus]|tara:strand:+ start:4847 stop:5617 length:771 start_codon:yes stop_codon:yes gene_type:complete
MFDSYEDIFKKRARRYHQAMELCPLARATEFSLAVQYLNIKSNMTLFDIPSGGGYLKKFVPVEKVNYIFVESSDDFASHCPVNDHSCTLLSGLTELPFASHSADRILSLAALHHVENKQKFFRQCLDLLKTDGFLVVGDVDEESKMAEFLNIFVNKYNSMGHEGLFFTKNIEASLKDISLEVVSNEYKPFFWEFDSIQKAIHFFRDLFGLDLATDKEIFSGIEEYLGFGDGASLVSINWGLRYLCLQPEKQVQFNE